MNNKLKFLLLLLGFVFQSQIFAQTPIISEEFAAVSSQAAKKR